MSFKGKKNIYMCRKCGHGFVTVDIDEGVTPFQTSCLNPGCGGHAASFCYRAPQEILADIRPALEWYRPTSEEMATLKPASLDHVAQGGLLSRTTQP